MSKSVFVLSACSGAKAHDPVICCKEIDNSSRTDLVAQYSRAVLPAESLYTGTEHEYVKEAVQKFQEIAEVEWRIISAGFGVIEPGTELPSYECTFREPESVQARVNRMGYDTTSMTAAEQIQTVAKELNIPQELKGIITGGFDIAFIVLGGDYLLATGGALSTFSDDTTAYAFAPEGNRNLIGDCQWIPSSATEREALNTVWTELKGRQLRNIAHRIPNVQTLEQQTAERVRDMSLQDLSDG